MIKKRLNEKEKQYIRKLIKSGSSLKTISKLMKKNKTTIYYYFRKIKGKTINPISVNSSNTELFGEFLGVVAGDGCLNKTKEYHYRIYLYFNSTESKYVNELIKKVLYILFSKYPLRFRRKPSGMFILYYCSKEMYSLIKKYLSWNFEGRKSHSVHLKTRNHNKKFKIGFLRGLIDSDGYLSEKKINFSTSSPYLAKDIRHFLKELGLEYYYNIYKEKRENRVNMHYIDIKKKDRTKFLRIINPRERKNMRRPRFEFPG
jgi:hypothetical protein